MLFLLSALQTPNSRATKGQLEGGREKGVQQDGLAGVPSLLRPLGVHTGVAAGSTNIFIGGPAVLGIGWRLQILNAPGL